MCPDCLCQEKVLKVNQSCMIYEKQLKNMSYIMIACVMKNLEKKYGIWKKKTVFIFMSRVCVWSE